MEQVHEAVIVTDRNATAENLSPLPTPHSPLPTPYSLLPIFKLVK
jgi:hypothetical protein